jgi:hypothetical protein
MALSFGAGRITVSGVNIARLHNITVNISYDNAIMRGDTRVFADNCQMYNGAIEGSWEWGELILSALGDIIGGTGSFAAGSGTWGLSATQLPTSGVQIIFSGITDGVTCTVTLRSVKVNSLALKFDRENYLMPSANFVCVGDLATDTLITIQQ